MDAAHITEMLYREGHLSDIDLRFAGLVQRLSGDRTGPGVFCASALASNMTTDAKHVCLDLDAVAGRHLRELFAVEAATPEFRLPERGAWLQELRRSPCVGAPGEYRPLILDSRNRLYLYRYWDYEQRLAQAINALIRADVPVRDDAELARSLARCFPSSADTPDWQKVAVFAAVTHLFCAITGGPGTGKTHTVAALMAVLLQLDPGLHIQLCAPTGKAAARLQETIVQAKHGLRCAERINELLPETAATIHRLLGFRAGTTAFVHSRDNPLDADVLIVDEASMVPLPLMTRLCEAIRPGGRVVLLGDKDQLASVETGAVLADICAAAETGCFSRSFCDRYSRIVGEPIPESYLSAAAGTLTDCMVELTRSYRFSGGQGIQTVSAAVKDGAADRALSAAHADGGKAVVCVPRPADGSPVPELQRVAEAYYEPMLRAGSREEAFAHLTGFRILSPYRRGRFGAERLNEEVERVLRRRNLVPRGERFYPGQPVMILTNDYGLELFNGDTGLVWPDSFGVLRAWFPRPDGTLRSISPSRLPDYETVFAMTVHKAQGSEFERVVLVLPEKSSPFLTREMLYTGITRARSHLELWMDPEVFREAVVRRILRTSGLKDSLAGLAVN